MKVVKLLCALAFLKFCMKSSDGHITDLGNGTHTKVGISKDCTEAWCERYSYQEVAVKYSGLFLTKFEFLIEEMIFYLDRDDILYHEGVKNLKYVLGSDGDGDSCCTTVYTGRSEKPKNASHTVPTTQYKTVPEFTEKRIPEAELTDADRVLTLEKSPIHKFKVYVIISLISLLRKIVYRIHHDLKNVLGQKRSVVHLSNSKQKKYQFISQAECIGKGKCDGKCVLEDSVRTILVYDGTAITFDQVMVPTYCSCKRIS